MMNTQHYTVRLLKFASLLAIALTAAAARGEEETRRVSLQVLSMEPSGIENLHIRTGNDWLPLLAPATYVPNPVKYEGVSPLVIYERRATGEEEGFEYVPVAFQELSEGLDEVLLLLRQNAGDRQLSVFPVRLQRERFPEGSFLFFNQTEKSVGVLIGDERFTLEPRATRFFRPSNRVAGTLQVNMIHLGDEELESLVAQTWF
jgi:hypothetical protein